MRLLIDVLTVITLLYFFIASLKKVLKGKYSILHLCVIVFFVIQVLPIGVEIFGADYSKIEIFYPYMNYAMTDVTVAVIYDFFVIATELILYHYANKLKRSNTNANFSVSLSGKTATIIQLLCVICIFLPVIAVFVSPTPSVYTQFAYFVHNGSSNIESYIFHTTVMKAVVYLSFASTLFLYYFNSSKYKYMVYLSIFIITWVNGRRTLMLFLLIGILVIDFLKWDIVTRKQIKKLMRKAFVFAVVVIVYYIFYKEQTGKSDFANNFLLYSTYFSRLSNVKVSIYDQLYTRSMLDYPFETLLFDVLFFIPRAIWDSKPLPFFSRFTYYTLYGSGVGIERFDHIGWNFQVNIWSEFIANAGFFGWLLAIWFVVYMAKIAEKSKSRATYLIVAAFLVLYFMYGFEHIVQATFLAFVFTQTVAWIKRHIKMK